MKDDSLVPSEPAEAGHHEIYSGPGKQSESSEATPNPGAPTPHSPLINGNSVAGSNGEPIADKSDSEAETVVLSGKEEGKDHQSKKAIKLEEASGLDPDVDSQPDAAKPNPEDKRERSTDVELRKSSLKRKRVMLEHGNVDDPDCANSSNLSSTVSSPVQEARSSKGTDSASNRSRSSPPSDEVAQAQERRAHKARTELHSTQIHHEGGKSDRVPGPVTGRKRRDTRSATHYDEPIHRSESPPSRQSNRAQSIHSISPHSGVTKRRRAPAPLHVERRRKASEDAHPESEDDSSVHSHHRLQKLASTENIAISPAKMVSHKKNRDRNGRTLLARACQQGEAADVEQWLKERPQDIDVPDNAGNTPLQIAALDGSPEIVQLLLDAGCDVECKNIDKDTPLIDAVENGHLEVVNMLLKAGLDPRQTNAFGKEPLDLVKADDEHAEAMREALLTSQKEKALLRRPSEDSNRQHSAGSRDVEMTGGTASGASPINSTRSPPPVSQGARRRTARSQPTDDALLWVNPTPARLRDAAGKGDLTILNYILNMNLQVDTESMLAAARGGHDEALNLMLATATIDPDPEPLRSGDHKPGYSTPMLAAIGRGNTKSIELLLAQPGFDPTRRLYREMTYYELAKDRQGSDWEKEYDILKSAFDSYKPHGGRNSSNNSPRKVRSKRADSSKSGSEPSSSPHEARKKRKPNNSKEASRDVMKTNASHKGTALAIGQEDRKQRSPAFTSEFELESLGATKSKVKESKAGGDRDHSTSRRTDSLKPKRRLMSGNDFKHDQDMRRRASLAAEADLPKPQPGESVGDKDVRRRRFSDASESISKIASGQPLSADGVMGKKRHRMSVSPQASKSDLPGSTDPKRKKRQRVDSQGNAIDQDRDRTFRPGAPAVVANMIVSPTIIASPTVSQGTAPVAFMGSNVTSPINQPPTEFPPHSTIISSVKSIDQATSQRPNQGVSQSDHQLDKDNTTEQAMGQELASQALEDEERALQAEAEQKRLAQAEKEDREREARIAREREEEALLEEQRQTAEAERQIRLEREQEETRQAKLKRDEEMLQQRMDQERLRKEEQERRRREMEERESLRRLRMQEDEERQRLQSLPNGLRRAAELGPEEARDAIEIKKWLPLCTVETQMLDPNCEPQVAEEKWIANVQAAPILAVKDLDLSQCMYRVAPLPIRQCPNKCADTAWTRFPATINHRGSLWRLLRNKMSQTPPSRRLTPMDAYNLDVETRPKFFNLPHVFWIKYADFMDIVPRHKHLVGLPFRTIPMVLHEFPFGKGGSWDRPATSWAEGSVKQEAHSPMMNDHTTNGFS